MTLIIDSHIKQIQDIIKKFNKSPSPTERYALLLAYNHVCENQMPIHGRIEEETRKCMLIEQGVEFSK
jgi:hypothetical protein